MDSTSFKAEWTNSNGYKIVGLAVPLFSARTLERETIALQASLRELGVKLAREQRTSEILRQHLAVPTIDIQEYVIKKLDLVSRDAVTALGKKLSTAEENGRKLREAMSRVHPECHMLHHKKGEYHDHGEDCPVMKLWSAALTAYESAKKGDKSS
jgi:hypothetical protein